MIPEWVWAHPCWAKPKHLLLGVRCLTQVPEILQVASVKQVLESSIIKTTWVTQVCVRVIWQGIVGVQAPKSPKPYMSVQAYPVLGRVSAHGWEQCRYLSPTWLGAVCWRCDSAQGPLNPALHWAPGESCAKTRLPWVNFWSVLRDFSQHGVKIQGPSHIQSHSLVSWNDNWGVWGLGFAAAML